MENKKLLTVKEVAEYLNISELTVKRHLYSGKLKGYKAGRQWRIKREDLEEYLKVNE